MSSSVCAVDVVGLMNWESKSRGMVCRGMVNRGMVDRGMLCRDMMDRSMVDRGQVDGDSVGWVLVHRGGVGRLLLLVMVVGTRVLWGGGASFVRPGVVWEPGRVGYSKGPNGYGA